MSVLEHHILLPSCLDAYREWHVVACNSPTNMYTGFFVVEHKKGIFLHPHAHRLRIIVVALEGLYCQAASDVTNVLVTYEEVPCELPPPLHTPPRSVSYVLPLFAGWTNPNVDES